MHAEKDPQQIPIEFFAEWRRTTGVVGISFLKPEVIKLLADGVEDVISASQGQLPNNRAWIIVCSSEMTAAFFIPFHLCA